jgi:hypothetical protein
MLTPKRVEWQRLHCTDPGASRMNVDLSGLMDREFWLAVTLGAFGHVQERTHLVFPDFAAPAEVALSLSVRNHVQAGVTLREDQLAEPAKRTTALRQQTQFSKVRVRLLQNAFNPLRPNVQRSPAAAHDRPAGRLVQRVLGGLLDGCCRLSRHKYQLSRIP